jgi:NADH dehydrogenase
MKVLVTGGTGVIGEALVPELLKAGHTVRLLSRGASDAVKELPEGVEPFSADIAKPGSIAGAADGCSAVIHITGIVEEHPPESTFQSINVEGTSRMLKEAERAGVQRFIYISSLGADRGASAYHLSKREAEGLASRFREEWVILRPGNVYGPGDDVISVLLKMVRTMPAVPMIEGGDQPFQPIWAEDFAKAIAAALTEPGLHGKTLELAGADITTTSQVIDCLCDLTGRRPAKVAFPSWLAQFGVKLAEGLGLKDALAEKAHLSLPLNSSKLKMLMEENVIRDPRNNALIHVFHMEPTPLQAGLARLADELPESGPSEGVGKLEQKRFWADIANSAYDASGLIQLARHRITEVMAIQFEAEPGVPRESEPGATFTGKIPGRGNIQVRTIEEKPLSFAMVTVEGHPLAGLVRFSAEDLPDGKVRFQIETIVRASNGFDWLALKTFGQAMQNQNWIATVENVGRLSGGTIENGVQMESAAMGEEEARDLEARVEGLIHHARRKQKEEVVAGAASPFQAVHSEDLLKT